MSQSHNTPKALIIWHLETLLSFWFFLSFLSPVFSTPPANVGGIDFFLLVFLFYIFLSGFSDPLKDPIAFLLGESIRESSSVKLESTCFLCFREGINHSFISKLLLLPARSPHRRKSERIWTPHLYVNCGKSFFPNYSHPVFETSVVTFYGSFFLDVHLTVPQI